ncbi:MAG: xanthomonadin biosynthesis protein [Proteobacteria bacterium]|nr:xanthomonadin biosynthesis protein [Pseudomonadota bacterium]
MSVSTDTPRTRAPRRSTPWLPLLLAGYALLALLGGVLRRPLLSAFALALLVIALGIAAARRRNAWGVAGWLSFAALAVAAVSGGRMQLLLSAVPIAALLVVAWIFLRTLRRGREPLIVRCIRLIEGEARLALPGVSKYARGATWYWGIVLVVQAAVLAALWLSARPGGLLEALGIAAPWPVPRADLAWYPEAGCWAMLALAFAVEYGYRRWALRDIPHPPVKRFIAHLLQRWPQLLREGVAA